MEWPSEEYRVVKLFEPDHGNPTLVVVTSPDDLSSLNRALRQFVDAEDQGELDASLAEFLEERGFTVPLSYSAHWPFDKELGE